MMDSHGARSTATVTVNVTARNDAPMLSNQGPATACRTPTHDSFAPDRTVTGGDARQRRRRDTDLCGMDGRHGEQGPVAGAYGY